jgi:hypothetical protein
MLENEITRLTDLQPPIWGTFLLPKVVNQAGVLSTFNRHDIDEAEDFLKEWYFITNKVTPFDYWAFPEVLGKDGTTYKALHYHALFAPKNPAKFIRIASRKWEYLLNREYPSTPKPNISLFLEKVDWNQPGCPVSYCLKNSIKNDFWGWNHRITNDGKTQSSKSLTDKAA